MGLGQRAPSQGALLPNRCQLCLEGVAGVKQGLNSLSLGFLSFNSSRASLRMDVIDLLRPLANRKNSMADTKRCPLLICVCAGLRDTASSGRAPIPLKAELGVPTSGVPQMTSVV